MPAGVTSDEHDRLGVELDLAPRSWTAEPAGALRDAAAAQEPVADAATRWGVAVRRWLLFGLACSLLLGQGERFRVDPRFRTPGRALETYWRAIRLNDLQTVSECFTEPDASQPFPGMLWFLPPVDKLRLQSVRVVSAEAGRIVASYEVRFVPVGSAEEQSFQTTTELARVGHEWRIVPPDGRASMPEWKPYPRPVDS